MKSIQEFYDEVLKSKDLQKEFAVCKKKEDVTTFLREHDCEASFEDLQKLLHTKHDKEGKIDEKELEKLSGAGSCPNFYCTDTLSLLEDEYDWDE